MILASEVFPYNPIAMGAGLTVFNIVIIPFMTLLGAQDMVKQENVTKKSNKLQTQLLFDKAEDKGKFVKAWRQLSLAGLAETAPSLCVPSTPINLGAAAGT